MNAWNNLNTFRDGTKKNTVADLNSVSIANIEDIFALSMS